MAFEEAGTLLIEGDLTEDEVRRAFELFTGGDKKSLWLRYEAGDRLLEMLREQPGTEAEQYRVLRAIHDCLLRVEKPGSMRLGLTTHALARLLLRYAAPEEAIDLLRQSLDRIEVGHVTRSYVAYALVNQLQMIQRYEEAWSVLEVMRVEMERYPGPEEMRRSLDAMRGVVQMGKGLPDLAAPYVFGAFEFEYERMIDPRLSPNPGGLIAAYQALSELLRKSRRYELALEMLEPLLEHEELFARHAFARGGIRIKLAAVHLELELADPAHRERAARRIEEALVDPDLHDADYVRGHVLRAYLALREGRLDDAADDVEEAWILLGRTSARLPEREQAILTAVEARVARERGTGPDMLLLERFEPAVEAMVAGWRAIQPRIGGLSYLRDPMERFAVAELMHAEAGLRGPEAALETLLEVRSAGSFARLLEAPASSVEDVVERLVPQDGALLVFFPGIDWMGTFTVDAEGVAYRGAPVETDLLLRCRELSDLLTRDPRTAGGAVLERRDALARELGAVFFPEEPAARYVTVVGRDLLAGLPFEALRLPSGGTVATALAVGHLPSLPVGLALLGRELERAADVDLCLLTNAAFGPEAARLLPDAEAVTLTSGEIGELFGGLPEERVVTLLGERATLERLAHEAGRARMAHVFTHGLRDPARELSAGLALSPFGDHDGLLFGEHVLGLDPPSLVVLSACGSGRGPERFGDAVAAHLGGAFLLAGADAVVLADTDVDQVGTHRLMSLFQRELVAGAGPAEALRRATVALAASAAYADPFHHARFRVLGLAHRPLFEPREPEPAAIAAGVPDEEEEESGVVPWLVGAGAVALLALVLFAVRRRG